MLSSNEVKREYLSSPELEDMNSSVTCKTGAIFGLSGLAIQPLLSLRLEVQRQKIRGRLSYIFLFVHQSDRWCFTLISRCPHTLPHT